MEVTKRDRCDRCVAQAQVVVEMKAGILMFCNHHYNKHRPTLIAQNAVMVVIPEEKKEEEYEVVADRN